MKRHLDAQNPQRLDFQPVDPVQRRRQFWEVFGADMTLCIAAIAGRDRKIVTISDHMLTDYNTSMTAEVFPSSKLTIVRGKWIVLFAGDTSVREKINTAVNASVGKKPPTTEQMMAAYKSAFREALTEKIEDEFLSVYGMTLKQFLQRGRKVFGEVEFAKMKEWLREFKLETSFLVAGFDEQARGVLFTVSDPGVITSQTHLGFHAIGSGCLLANASLFFSFVHTDGLAGIVYRVAEAKFRGEHATGVGKATTVCILGEEGDLSVIRDPRTQLLRDLWKQYGQSPLPTGLDAKLSHLLRQL